MIKNILVVLAVCLLCSCSDSSEELGRGYWLSIEGPGANEILTHDPDQKGVPPSILRYNYNDSFIIVEQKPNKLDDVMHESINYPDGRLSLYYWVIIKDSTRVIGPMNKIDYEITRNRYRVPNSLNLKSIY